MLGSFVSNKIKLQLHTPQRQLIPAWSGAGGQVFGSLSNASRALEKSENGLLTQQLISQSEADV